MLITAEVDVDVSRVRRKAWGRRHGGDRGAAKRNSAEKKKRRKERKQNEARGKQEAGITYYLFVSATYRF
jgi:hypothetical protein